MNEKIEKAYCATKIYVQWGDMDAAQHVNNTVYLRWMETGRIAMFEKMNLGAFEQESVFPILAWQDCKYIFPVTFPDQVTITYDITELEEDRVQCQGRVYSKKHQKLVAISNCTLMAYDIKNAKKMPFPGKWKNALIHFYGESIIK